MIDLSVRGLVKGFEQGNDILKGITFDINAGERVGILGRNGCGKTTFFRILSGELQPDAGTVSIASGRRLGLISQIPVYPDGWTTEDVLREAHRQLYDMEARMNELTARMATDDSPALLAEYDRLSENFRRLGGYDMEHERNRVANGLDIPAAMRAQPFDSLSGGEKTRVNLARLILEDTDILLLDEPTNHLDMGSIDWLCNLLKNHKGTVIVISHNRYFLNEVCTNIADLDYQEIRLFTGNYDDFMTANEIALEKMRRENARKESRISELKEFINRFGANASKARQATSRQKELDKIQLEEIKPSSRVSPFIRFTPQTRLGEKVIEGVELAKSYDVKLFENFSPVIGNAEKIAIIGTNGVGKTTLLKILLKLIEPCAGNVIHGDTVELSYFPQDASDILCMEDRAIDWLARFAPREGLTEQELRSFMGKMLFSGDEVNKPVKVLSGGEKARLVIAKMMLEAGNVLALDEPTNHLDLRATEWLEAYLLHFRGTVLVISHDRYFLDRVVQRSIDFTSGQAEFYNGNYSFYVVERQRRFDEQLKKYEKDQAKLQQLTEAAAKLHLWAFMGNDKLHKRAFSIEKRMEKLETTERPTEARKLNVHFTAQEFRGDDVLTMAGLSKHYGERTLFHDLDLTVTGGERIALIGDNGAGKTTFLKLVMNEETPDTGWVQRGPSVRTAYLPQIVRFAVPERSMLDTMLYECKCTPQEARDQLGAYGFCGEDVLKPVSALSGGELSRLRLCMLMRREINFLILDEPTNHLDIASREWIEDALSDYTQALLFVSHDRYFIEKFATRIWLLENGTITDYRGTYEQFREYRARQTALQQTAKAVERKKEPKPKPKRAPNTTRQRERTEREIEKLEGQLAALDAESEANATDYQKLMELDAQKQALNAQLEALYEAWEALCE